MDPAFNPSVLCVQSVVVPWYLAGIFGFRIQIPRDGTCLPRGRGITILACAGARKPIFRWGMNRLVMSWVSRHSKQHTAAAAGPEHACAGSRAGRTCSVGGFWESGQDEREEGEQGRDGGATGSWERDRLLQHTQYGFAERDID
jgi:hypothetical protein